jgi:hypothetical protein
MSPTNLSRRAILAGAASVPALTLPAAVAVPLPAVVEPVAPASAAAVVELPNPDAALIALGKQLKQAVAKAAKLERVSERLYEACLKASRYEDYPERLGGPEASREFHAMAKKNGYDAAYDKWNDACEPRNKLALAILEIPSHTRIGDGVRAAATLVDNAGDMDDVVEMMLWEMAARAGFKPPAEIAKRLGRKTAGTATMPKPKPDPIFAAIKAHHAAGVEWLRHVKFEDKLGKIIPSEKRRNYTINDRDDPTVGKEDDPRWTAARKEFWTAHDKLDNAAIALTKVAPTTVAGAAALLDYCAKTEAKMDGSLFPDLQDDDLVGNSVGVPFLYFVCKNAAAALKEVQS